MLKIPKKIAVLGMGYVGTPLAIELAKNFEIVGFDAKKKRIEELKKSIDITNDLDKDQLNNLAKIRLSSNKEDLRNVECFIVTVPTPVKENNVPDFRPLESATKTIANYLTEGSIVVYESTVYPGATEEICVPILESFSKLTYNKDFYCGYSPERINPGDKEHTIRKIKKITSGSTPEAAEIIDKIYKKIIDAGTFKASSIMVAEAAKVIENSQRDINIAFMNELSKIFSLLNIDTLEVLEAAQTKWNFLPFKPGLVGGHCIGVDPYYLSFKSEQLGYSPKMILSGREINDSMSNFVFSQVVSLLLKNSLSVSPSTKVLILGATFKEDCSDIRNSKVFNLIQDFQDKGLKVEVFDPHVAPKEFREFTSAKLHYELPDSKEFSALILAVGHESFKKNIKKLPNLLIENGIIFDIKGFLPQNMVHGRL
tara:strand:- start:1431 stop:2708 length:1278 start_codon:yes stop_codon:yes gene_type:complete